MTEDSKVVRARAVREVHRELTMDCLNKLKGTPHDPVGTPRGGGRHDCRREELAAHEGPDHEGSHRAVRSDSRVPGNAQAVMDNNKASVLSITRQSAGKGLPI